MRRVFLLVSLGILAYGGAAGVHAQQAPDRQELLRKVESKMRAARHMAFHPTILRAVRRHNSQQLSMDVIQERDAEWRASQGETGLQRSILRSEASRVLQTLVEQNADFNEAFVAGNQGANVAMYPTTSDYWQGDETKWISSFNNGEGRVFVGDVELDESTNTAAVQVSVPILDQGQTIGVLVVGITQSYLQE